MDAIMIALSPEECKSLTKNELTVKLLKRYPKLQFPFKCYVYMKMNGVPEYIYDKELKKHNIYLLHPNLANGRVIGEFTCDKMYTFEYCEDSASYDMRVVNETGSFTTLLTAMTQDSICKYGKGSTLFGLHVSNFILYKKMLFPTNFTKPCTGCKKKGTNKCTEEDSYCRAVVLQKGPTSWCYVGELNGQ